MCRAPKINPGEDQLVGVWQKRDQGKRLRRSDSDNEKRRETEEGMRLKEKEQEVECHGAMMI